MTIQQQPMKLSRNCTVSQYRRLELLEDKNAIADFIESRFNERYLDPIEAHSTKKHGFTIMAVSCLMIEALESFSLGWTDSRGKSKKAFLSFFSRWQEFTDFEPLATDFYLHIRCGILHQAETTGGWRIRRTGPLLSERTINASRFSQALRRALGTYSLQLREHPWDAPDWLAFRKKMDAVCRNTEAIV